MSSSSRSVDRALDLLCRIARAADQPRFTDLLAATGLPRATLHGLLASLQRAGFVDRTAAGYRIGVTAFEVGVALPVSADLRDELAPALDVLAADTGEACHLGTLAGTDVVYLDRRDNGEGLRFISRIGQRLPAHNTGLGKAMLALESDEALVDRYPERLEQLTGQSIATRDELLAQLADIRERGYSTDSGESTPGVCCVGMAVSTPGGPLGLSVTVPTQRAEVADLPRFLPALRAAVERVQKRAHAHHWFGATGHAAGDAATR